MLNLRANCRREIETKNMQTNKISKVCVLPKTTSKQIQSIQNWKSFLIVKSDRRTTSPPSHAHYFPRHIQSKFEITILFRFFFLFFFFYNKLLQNTVIDTSQCTMLYISFLFCHPYPFHSLHILYFLSQLKKKTKKKKKTIALLWDRTNFVLHAR